MGNIAWAAELDYLINNLDDRGVIRFFNNVAYALLKIVGVIAVLVVLYAGFLYMTSGGDEKALEEAKHFISYAIMGLVLAALAFSVTALMNSLLT